jgi:hypothetical protein
MARSFGSFGWFNLGRCVDAWLWDHSKRRECARLRGLDPVIRARRAEHTRRYRKAHGEKERQLAKDRRRLHILTEQIALGWGDTPGELIPRNWRSVAPSRFAQLTLAPLAQTIPEVIQGGSAKAGRFVQSIGMRFIWASADAVDPG